MQVQCTCKGQSNKQYILQVQCTCKGQIQVKFEFMDQTESDTKLEHMDQTDVYGSETEKFEGDIKTTRSKKNATVQNIKIKLSAVKQR